MKIGLDLTGLSCFAAWNQAVMHSSMEFANSKKLPLRYFGWSILPWRSVCYGQQILKYTNYHIL
ncbi:MAG TPA: hypothetical protein VHK70_06240 [Burkholderiaceae bacterium]|nr:hypothetical protein [Burkholderiaceae bacterium]